MEEKSLDEKKEIKELLDAAEEEEKGRRLSANNVKVQKLGNGQFLITFPKFIARAVNLQKGSIIKFEYLMSGGIRLKWKNPEDTFFCGEKQQKRGVFDGKRREQQAN